jgi:hypothetical protein
MVLDPHRWLELRRFRPLYESGALRNRFRYAARQDWETVPPSSTPRPGGDRGHPARTAPAAQIPGR